MGILIFPVIVMLSLGGIYAWSMFVPALQLVYGLSASQTQWIFGGVIASFTVSMLIADRLERKIGLKKIVALSGLLFAVGYLVAAYSGGRFVTLFMGIGLISGIGTGLGYMASLAMSVRKFPERKGLVSGIVSAGFAGGAIVLTYLTDWLLSSGHDVLDVFRWIGILYGVTILLVAFIMPAIEQVQRSHHSIPKAHYGRLAMLFAGILMGTFAGLMVIGNLKLIGGQTYLNHQLSFAIVLFSIANFTGRLAWGWASDKVSNVWLISVALLMQGGATYAIGHWSFGVMLFYGVVMAIGVGFAANFVLFAKEVAHLFGANAIGIYYPYVFLGYGLAGVLGPVTGGYLFDIDHDFKTASLVAGGIGLIGIVVFYLASRMVHHPHDE
jgi:MFS transporter, OFA family, oxalate/formate antiporter